MSEFNLLNDKKYTQEKFNKILGLNYAEQDWYLINANAKRLNEFIKCYEDNAKTETEKIELMSLILVSLDEYLTKNPNDLSYWHKVKPLLSGNEELFLGLIIYWTLKYTPDDLRFTLSPLMDELNIKINDE